MDLRSAWRIALVCATAAALAAVPAAAHDDTGSKLADDGVLDSGKETHRHDAQHGADEGHLPASSTKNVKLIGRADLADGPGRIADVAAKGNYAYLNAYYEPVCKTGGTYVVDIRDPARPERVGFIPSHINTYQGEGAQVITLDTASFKGDVLVVNNEICPGETNGVGGVSLIDVTKPLRPKKLVEGFGDFTVKGRSQRHANEIHSAFAWQDDGRAYVVMVDNEEATDVDILDITNPTRPVLIKELDLTAQTRQDGVHGDAVFLHDMTVKVVGGRDRMLLSYWDGGYVQLDVEDPRDPQFIGDTDFTIPDPERLLRGQEISPEGNGHQAEYTRDNKFFVATDEDFDPYRMTATITSTGETFTALQGDDVPKIDSDTSLTGATRFVGLACTAADVPAPGAAGEIAVVERGVCTFTEKAQAIQAKGYAGGIVFNRTGDDGCETLVNMLVSADIPMVFVSRTDGFRILGLSLDGYTCSLSGSGTAVPADRKGQPAEPVDIRATYDGWGYVHLYDTRTMQELDTYTVPEAQDPAFAEGFGDLSIHEVATDPDNNLAYFSYYGAGFRVAKVTGDGIEEVGHHIAPGGNNFWGVEVHKHPNGQKYVLASDRDSGLWIFQVGAR